MVQIPFVDLNAQHEVIRDEMVQALSDAIGKDLLDRPNLRAFEAEFAAYCGARYAIGVGSDTDALYLALRACGIGHGDEVITIANNFIAAVEAIVALGADPVFVDVDPTTFTLDPACLPAALSRRTRAIVPAHLYGQMADMNAIAAFAERHGLVVIEDASQAHGAEDCGRRAGSIGDAGVFSFDPLANIGACGNGSIVTTNSRAVAAKIRQLRNHGSVQPFEHEEMGISSSLDELEAAVLRVKLRHLDSWNERRRERANLYAQQLQEADVVLPAIRWGARHVYHLYVVQIDDRDRVREALADRGIETGIHYPIPIHRQPAVSGLGRVAGELQVTETLASRVLSLPMYAELKTEDLVHVATGLRETLKTC